MTFAHHFAAALAALLIAAAVYVARASDCDLSAFPEESAYLEECRP